MKIVWMNVLKNSMEKSSQDLLQECLEEFLEFKEILLVAPEERFTGKRPDLSGLKFFIFNYRRKWNAKSKLFFWKVGRILSVPTEDVQIVSNAVFCKRRASVFCKSSRGCIFRFTEQ